MWKKLIPQMITANLNLEREMYGVSWPADDQTPPQLINYFVGFVDASEKYPDNFRELFLEGGNYFEYKYVGAAADIDKGFLRAYTEELSASGLNSREGQHLELYGADYDPQAPIIKFSILIPVK